MPKGDILSSRIPTPKGVSYYLYFLTIDIGNHDNTLVNEVNLSEII